MKATSPTAELLQICFGIFAIVLSMLPFGIFVAAGKAEYKMAAIEIGAMAALFVALSVVVMIAGKEWAIERNPTIIVPFYILWSSLLLAQFVAPLIAVWNLVRIISVGNGFDGFCIYAVASAIGWIIGPLTWMRKQR